MTEPAGHPDFHARAALYFAGAMSAEERLEFEKLLRPDDADVAGLAMTADALAEAIAPVTPDPQVRAALFASIGGSSVDDRPAGQRTWDAWDDDVDDDALFTLRVDEGRWESTGIEGIEVRRLFVDRENDRMTAMFRMAPGTSYVPHRHDGFEECYVLAGDLHVGDDIHMHAGDYQRAPAGSLHGRQWTDGGCVLLISSSLSDEHI